MMGYYFGIVILALLAVLQNSILPELVTALQNNFFPGVGQFHGQPELVMLAVLAWGWHANDREALFWAIAGGIMQDLLNPIIPTGLSVLSIGVTVLVLKSAEENLYQFTSQPEQSRMVSIEQSHRPRPSIMQYLVTFPLSLVVLIGFTFVGTLLHHITLFGLFSFQGYIIPFGEYARTFTIPTLGLNLLVILPLYWILRRIQKRISA